MDHLEYTDTEKKLYSGRRNYLTQLKKSLSTDNSTIILAPQGFGKKTLIKELTDKTSSIYIDLAQVPITPEQFAVEFIAKICATDSKSPDIKTLLDSKMSERAKDLIRTIDNELQKIKPDQELLIKTALNFPEAFKSGMTIILYNFEELLNLNNYAQIKDALGLFKENTGKTKYILSTVRKDIVKKLGNNIDTIELLPFDEKESKEFIEKTLGKTDSRITKELHQLSAGIPAILKPLCLTFKNNITKNKNISEQLTLIRQIFISELVYRYSRTSAYCSTLYSTSLNNARGSSLLKALLKIISEHDNLKLSELSRLLYRSAPVTKSLIERLIEVDLIKKTGSTFSFTNPVLRQWCVLMFNNKQSEEEPILESMTELYNWLGGRT